MGKNKVLPSPKLHPRIKKVLADVDEMLEQRYMTRENIMEEIKIPENSPDLVVIKSNGKGTGFLKICYDAHY